MLELYKMVIVLRSVFHEGNKYCPKAFSDECLYKLSKNDGKTFFWIVK